MDFLSQTYIALRGPQGAPQDPLDTIRRLADRLSPSTLLADRRAAVLALKGLSKDWFREVSEYALPGLIDTLENDADVDVEIGKGVLEVLGVLCEGPDGPDGVEKEKERDRDISLLTAKNTAQLLSTPRVVHRLFALLVPADLNYYIRYFTLRLLSTLIGAKKHVVQAYFLSAPDGEGPRGLLSALEEKREVARNEALSVLHSLLTQNPDIQKLLAFEGAFDKLFHLIQLEGGLDSAFPSADAVRTSSFSSSVVVQESLQCIDALLRFNNSNQVFFREAGLIRVVLGMLCFPVALRWDEQTPQEFALQFWEEQKAVSAALVVDILGILVGSSATNVAATDPHQSHKQARQQVDETGILSRCLVELAVASNAPTAVKIQALHALPPTLSSTFALLTHIILPYVPVPETNGEEWDRLEPTSALDALIDLIVLGEYGGMSTDEKGGKGKGIKELEGLKLRAEGLGVFENYIRREDIRHAVLQKLIPNSDSDPSIPPLSPTLIQTLSRPPDSPLDQMSVTSMQFSALLFSALVRGIGGRCKELALALIPGLPAPLASSAGVSGLGFFVPADGIPPPADASHQEPDADEEPQTLLQIITEHISLCFLSRSRTFTPPTSAEPDALGSNQASGEARYWDRLIVAYLTLLSQWLWEEPRAVRMFLDSGGMSVLVEPINQTSGVDAAVQSLCAFLLGVCYEFNREAGEITRTTIHAILTRLGVDTPVGRMSRLREDQRFKSVTPEEIVLSVSLLTNSRSYGSNLGNYVDSAGTSEGYEIWFDWAFVDFWKSNCYTVQRAIVLDPNTLSSADSEHAETAAVLASYRDSISKQAAEIDNLRAKLRENDKIWQEQVDAQETKIASLSAELEALQLKKVEVEKEQEDLLVLLDEMSQKRKRDKAVMSQAGLDVSDEEDGDEEA